MWDSVNIDSNSRQISFPTAMFIEMWVLAISGSNTTVEELMAVANEGLVAITVSALMCFEVVIIVDLAVIVRQMSI
jgi:hypothetical protein